MSVRGLGLILAVVAAAIVGYVWYHGEEPDAELIDAEQTDLPLSSDDKVDGSEDSPFALQDVAESKAAASPSVAADMPVRDSVAASPEGDHSASLASSEPVDQIGQGAMSDEAQLELSAGLRKDRARLHLLIDSLRTQGDAERIRRLSIVLGEQSDPAVDALIEELAYSDDPALVVAGLDLMKRSGVDGGRARAIVSTLLANDSGPEVLVPALSAIARPGTATEEERQNMANQISLLASHESAGVRSASIDLLSRWTTDGSDTPTLLNALEDEDAAVRRAAAYSFVGHEASSEEVVAVLLSTAENSEESVAVRKAVILAVQRSPGASAVQQQRAGDILKALNRRPARSN